MTWMILWNRNIFWGPPMLILLLGIGGYLTIKTRGILFRRFGTLLRHTCGDLFRRQTGEGITPFQAVSTALAGTVGTGNIVGVALAIQLGGAGAIFWMWLSALCGMMTKYAEVTLAVAYRGKDKQGQWIGGPMYYMERGLGKRWLAKLFALLGLLCSFGMGNMVQSNAMAGAIGNRVPTWLTGAVASVLAMAVLIGGIGRIASVAQRLVPLLALLYLGGALVVLSKHRAMVPQVLLQIVRDAFCGSAAVGGFAGATVSTAMRVGMTRGIFTNEAGLGSAPIAHATAKNWHPARQGLWGAFEVFFDTLVMCTITALVLLCSPYWRNGGSPLEISEQAFAASLRGGASLVRFGLVCFAFATILAWYYYGEQCLLYLTRGKGLRGYQYCFCGAIWLGAVIRGQSAWELADFLNGLMLLPNLYALFCLTPTVQALTADFFRSPKQGERDYQRLLQRKMPRAMKRHNPWRKVTLFFWLSGDFRRR